MWECIFHEFWDSTSWAMWMAHLCLTRTWTMLWDC
jgi:hypothetical protein